MKKKSIGSLIISSAIVWGAVIICCAVVLKDTPYKEQVLRILTGGVVFHLLFIWAPIEKMFKGKKEEVKKAEST